MVSTQQPRSFMQGTRDLNGSGTARLCGSGDRPLGASSRHSPLIRTLAVRLVTFRGRTIGVVVARRRGIGIIAVRAEHPHNRHPGQERRCSRLPKAVRRRKRRPEVEGTHTPTEAHSSHMLEGSTHRARDTHIAGKNVAGSPRSRPGRPGCLYCPPLALTGRLPLRAPCPSRSRPRSPWYSTRRSAST